MYSLAHRVLSLKPPHKSLSGLHIRENIRVNPSQRTHNVGGSFFLFLIAMAQIVLIAFAKTTVYDVLSRQI